MSISSRVRFTVLHRDGFRCHYCGRGAPEVVLHVDHIIPKSEGGSDDVGNLIASCSTCNLGKATTQLVPVTPCHFCGYETAGMFFKVPNGPVWVDGEGQETELPNGEMTALVCGNCLALAVKQLHYCLCPAQVYCCVCHKMEPYPEHGQMEDWHMAYAGKVSWICKLCEDEELAREMNTWPTEYRR